MNCIETIQLVNRAEPPRNPANLSRQVHHVSNIDSHANTAHCVSFDRPNKHPFVLGENTPTRMRFTRNMANQTN